GPARSERDLHRAGDEARDDADPTLRRLRHAVTAALPASDRAADLAFTVELGERAGKLLTERFEKVERIDFKSAKDVVTEVDHLSEELIIEAIRAAHPGDGIVA